MEKKTIYQRLEDLFGPEKHKISKSRYSLDDKQLLKTQSKEEYEVAKLQAQQNKYLSSQWQKVDGELFQQSVYYETTRIASYSDFEGMEFYPEIAAALDIFMEESTTQNKEGRVLNIFSESKRVKRILQDLFFNRLDIHTSLPMWTRNTPVREDSIIPLLDGTEVTIKELSNKIKNGEEVWSYAIQDKTNSIVPSKIIWCDLTRKDSELIRVTLDDGTHIDTTPDHEYMLRNGSFKRADELTEGQSLMPFYSRKSEKKKDCIVGYEKIYNPSSTKYKFTHSLVAHECVRDLVYETSIGCQFDTHHNDFNKLNNNPSNLIRLTHSDHFKLHIEHFDKILGSPEVIKKRMDGIDRYLRSDKRRETLSKEMKGIYPKYFEEYNHSELHSEHNKIRSGKMLNNWDSSEFIEKTKKGMTIQISDNCLEYISNIIKNNENYIGINKLAKLLKEDEEFIKLFKEKYTLRKDIRKSINTPTLNNVIFRKTNQNYFDFVISIKSNLILDKSYIKSKSIYLGKTKEKTLLNHKVVSVIKLNETSDVYCLEAVGPNGEHDRHNFPVLGKDVTGSYSRTSGVFLSNCKYGDNFLFLKIEDEKGIVGVKQLPNIEIERKEADNYRIYNANDPLVKEGKKDTVSFFWKNKDITFNSWQIGHFRLLGDDRRLPYGTSVLEKARRIWKQLLLSEDAMLVYRVTRAPERRIFKIYVGNIDEQDVPSYVQKIANNFKKTPVIDQRTGQIDTRYNQMAQDQDYFIPVRDPSAPSPIETLPGACIDLNTRIPLLDGRTLKLSEIINEWDNGNRDIWVYSCNPKTGEFVPGMITWAGVTRKDTDVMKITLDNGEEIIATPDHKFLHREGYKLECKDLKEGMSLMPFYRKNNHIKDNEMIFDHSINDWVLTHEKVSNFHKNIVQEKINSDSEYIESVNEFYNHKIVKIEYLVDKIDTGTITVDGNEIYHNFHTFAIESGIYIFNSNLSEIADIEYLQKKLFTALRVPKPFLGFEDVNGVGKNLALQDIRFTRTINRIQQSMVQELNKIAIVHLYLLGLEDELENFTLSLNNPSTQADMLRTEQLAQKIQVYRDSVADAGNGFGAMSMTRAKRDILGMSEEEIRLDIEQQRLEKAAAAELANTSNVIKKTGIFDKIDRMYGEFGVTPEEAAKTAEGAEGGEEMGGMESSFGGGGSMSTPSTPTESPEEPEPTETPEPAAEGFNRSSDKLLTEEVNKRKFEEKMKKYKNIYTNRLLESLDRENEKLNKVSNIDKNKDFLNEEIDKISKFIDDVIKD